MSKYNSFLALFVISIVAFIFFMASYLQIIFAFVMHSNEYSNHQPIELLATIFTPRVIISVTILGISSLIYRILGIVYVARSSTVSDGEKAIWIIGFVLMGFISGIVFLILAKGKKFV
ncbi:MAG: hypothetical protein ABIW38_15205 [Ferruginibacter sp.]